MTENDAKVVNMDEWNLVGGGYQGESYFHKTDPTLILKLFAPDAYFYAVNREFEITNEIAKTGIQTTVAYDLVKHENRYGIIYQRILHKRSFCRTIADDPSTVEDMARRFALMAKDLHSRPSQGTSFESTQKIYRELLAGMSDVDPELRKILNDNIDELEKEETETLVHGDFHFGNVITDGKKDYFIDLGAFAYGHPNVDIAMLFFVCLLLPEPYVVREYHITREQALDFWHFFVKYYYDTPKTDEEIAEEVRPYILERTIFFDFCNTPKEDVAELREILFNGKLV